MEQSEYLDIAADGYVECATWADWPTDENGNESEATLTLDGQQKLCEDLRAFVADQWEDVRDLDPSQVGHDFWLTRNRHGAGFWDRGLGELGDKLTRAAHVYGEEYLDNYVEWSAESR